jgi:hypothetical protein
MPGTYSAAGVAASFFLAANSPWGTEPPPKVDVTPDGSFLSEWDSEVDTPQCTFYNASYVYTAGLCSHFTLARMSAATQNKAIERALSCGAHFETDCILSPEIGLSVPAAFVYDPTNGLKMIIAPKLLPLPPKTSFTTKIIAFQDPGGKRTGYQFHMNQTINTEYLEGGSRKMTTQILEGEAAYCVQLLRIAFDSACWKEID